MVAPGILQRYQCLPDSVAGAVWAVEVADSILQLAGLAGFLFLPRWVSHSPANANARRFLSPVAMGIVPAAPGASVGLSMVGQF
jgi:hypothetical protein